MLKRYKDQDYGFVKNNVIGINIERIWLETNQETRFIREFAKTYAHELLHLTLAKALKNKKRTDAGEEKVIRKLCKEPWNKEIESAYKEAS